MTTSKPAQEMRLLIVVLQGAQNEQVAAQLRRLGAHVTTISSTGGFLRRRSVTLLVGVAADAVEYVLATVRELCPTPPEAKLHTATVFVLRAEQFVAF